MTSAGLLLYFVAGACLLRFALDPLVLPHVDLPAHAIAPLSLRIGGDDGNVILVRRYGTAKLGCVVFFPGQHGLISTYERHLFPAFLLKASASWPSPTQGRMVPPANLVCAICRSSPRRQ